MFFAKMAHCGLSFCLMFALGLQAADFASAPIGLEGLEKALAYDLELIDYPPPPLRIAQETQTEDPVLDVAIIGAGMAGLAAGAALFKEGIFNIQLFDQNPQGSEGPWVTYARMRTLRSDKEEMGPALSIPHLTFHAWYEAQFGTENWEKLDRVPNQLWMDYLVWYRQVLQLPVENEYQLISVIPQQEHFLLEFSRKGQLHSVKAVKVVFATGRGGFGGPIIPEFVKALPKSAYAHVMEPIDFDDLKGKRVGIIGVGSSAFDAAGVALESGAKSVDLLMRSINLPCVNKFSSLPDHCFRLGFYKMSEKWRWKLMSHVLMCTVPPPRKSIRRVRGFDNFFVKSNVAIQKAEFDFEKVKLETNQGRLNYDFIILGTGYEVNGGQQPELRYVIDAVQLWNDRDLEIEHPCQANYGRFPFLGPSFEFLEKVPGTAPYLKHLYCFNFASMMSHGTLSSDIGSVSFGAARLAEGIAVDFLQEQSESYLEQLEAYQTEDFPVDYLKKP